MLAEILDHSLTVLNGDQDIDLYHALVIGVRRSLITDPVPPYKPEIFPLWLAVGNARIIAGQQRLSACMRLISKLPGPWGEPWVEIERISEKGREAEINAVREAQERLLSIQ